MARSCPTESASPLVRACRNGEHGGSRPETQARRELQRRLNRLGVTRRPAATLPRDDLSPIPGARLASGTLQQTPLGPAWVIEQRFPLHLGHGHGPLHDILSLDPADAARVAGRPRLAEAPVNRWVFLDTETTGLAGGAGTLVFLVGIGGIQADHFVLKQFFLRSPVEEAGMLQALWEDLGGAPGLVTFNGGAFDLPLLETRYRLAHRREFRLTDRPHLDLLHPSRRLWRRSLPDCSLGTLERRVLGVERELADVPGALIPALYLDYLRRGDPTAMEGVLYHNTQDILSLVRLAGEVVGRFTGAHPESLSGAEALGVAGWHRAAGRARGGCGRVPNCRRLGRPAGPPDCIPRGQQRAAARAPFRGSAFVLAGLASTGAGGSAALPRTGQALRVAGAGLQPGEPLGAGSHACPQPLAKRLAAQAGLGVDRAPPLPLGSQTSPLTARCRSGQMHPLAQRPPRTMPSPALQCRLGLRMER